MTKKPAQQMILEAVITCIEKYGVEKTTTRKIAKEAGTNLASINYYFRSKDDLIAQALDVTLQNMREDLLIIVQDSEQSFEAVLRAWITYLLEGAQQYPGVLMAHMYAPIVEKHFDTPGTRVFRDMVDLIEERARQEYPQKDPKDIRFALVEVVSAMIFRILAPRFFYETDIQSPAELSERYVVLFERAISAGEVE